MIALSVGISVNHRLLRSVRYTGILSLASSRAANVARVPLIAPICFGISTSSGLADSRAAASPMMALIFSGESASAKRFAVSGSILPRKSDMILYAALPLSMAAFSSTSPRSAMFLVAVAAWSAKRCDSRTALLLRSNHAKYSDSLNEIASAESKPISPREIRAAASAPSRVSDGILSVSTMPRATSWSATFWLTARVPIKPFTC